MRIPGTVYLFIRVFRISARPLPCQYRLAEIHINGSASFIASYCNRNVLNNSDLSSLGDAEAGTRIIGILSPEFSVYLFIRAFRLSARPLPCQYRLTEIHVNGSTSFPARYCNRNVLSDSDLSSLGDAEAGARELGILSPELPGITAVH